MNSKSELRLTDTNAASDSKGKTWGLEGGLFWWLIIGIGTGIIVFFVLLVLIKESLGMSFLIALVPVSLCLTYIFALRQGKPPGYDKGRSDAVKQQYWLYVSMQQAKAGDDGRVRLYEVHLPEQVIDGVIFQPTTQFLRIEAGGTSTR